MTTELSREALLPCPFCESSHITDRHVRDGRQMFCVNCGASVAPTYHGPTDTLERARAAWNRRALPTPDAGDGGELVAEMRAGLEGVTPGLWAVDGYSTDAVIYMPEGETHVSKWKCLTKCATADGHWRHNAAHIARCSPNNIAKLLDHAAAQASRIKELEAGDVQRVKDISRLTIERDASRELLEQAKALLEGFAPLSDEGSPIRQLLAAMKGDDNAEA